MRTPKSKHLISMSSVVKKRMQLASAVATLDAITCMDEPTFRFFFGGLLTELGEREVNGGIARMRQQYEYARNAFASRLEQCSDLLLELRELRKSVKRIQKISSSSK